MAEEEKNTGASGDQNPEDRSKGSAKGPLKMIGGIALIVGLGAAAAVMAVPSKRASDRFQGPFHCSLFEEKFSSNTRDNDQRRFLQTLLDCMYFAYDEGYMRKRTSDPLYRPILRDAVGRVISDKTLDEASSGPAREIFLAELRDVLDPILFPVHIGATKLPLDRDEVTGLRPGISFDESTFRGRFHDHVLHVDAKAGTLRIDDGPEIRFDGSEEDLEVTDGKGATLHVDVTEIEPGFQGEVEVGVHGRIRQLFATDLIAQ